MRKTISTAGRLMLAVAPVIMFLFACGKTDAGGSDGKVEFKTDMDKISYIIGYQIAQDFKSNNFTSIEVDRLTKAIDDVLGGKESAIPESDMQAEMQKFVGVLRAQQEGKTSEEKVDYKKVSYIIGFQIGTDFKNNKIEGLSTKLLGRAVSDVMGGKEPAIPAAEMDPIMEVFSNDLREKQMAEMEKQKAENTVEASVFLAENAAKSGIVTLADSLQYEILTTGSGPKPKAEDTVKVHYKGTFLDGSEFDSSYKRNEPAEFPVQGVIMGWQEALQLMPVGSKWKVFIPPALAYGEMGRPGIPPNKLLVFEMELLEIVAAAK